MTARHAGHTASVAQTTASGRQVELRHGELVATLTEVGAGLRHLSAAGRPLVQTYGEAEIPTYGHGQVLAPWPNRVARGAYEFGGERLQLPLSEPALGNAIHGLVRWMPWLVAAHEPDRAVFAVTVPPQAGYPFRLLLSVEYRVDSGGLTVLTTARNAGAGPLPYGCGFHPYLTVGTESIDEAVLTLPAGTRLPADDAGIPTGERVPAAGTPWDFRSPRAVGALELDTAFGDLARDADGRFEVRLESPRGEAVVLWADAAYAYVMAFTGDTLPPPLWRRSLAIEPMTCAPDALRSGDGLVVLAPGESHSSRWGIRPG